MSLSHLLIDEYKPYANIRVNDLKVDTTMSFQNPPNINLSNTYYLSYNLTSRIVELTPVGGPSIFTDVKTAVGSTGLSTIYSGQSTLNVELFGVIAGNNMDIVQIGQDYVINNTIASS